MPLILRNYTPFQFSIFRVTLCLYMMFLFWRYLPSVFASDGFSLTYLDFFPQKYVFSFFGILSLALLLGFYRR
ncbi:MAG: hypothetical protein SGJ18_16000, partial [Pseudomonadota bacterium]|nr:hypothetical protein [Pseudomonadota bacterium]